MHPDIVKFWEATGKEIRLIDKPTGGYTNVPLYLVGDTIVCAPYFKELSYYYNGSWYSEDVMLRILKLKHFL
jgi:hypothetical protein